MLTKTTLCLAILLGAFAFTAGWVLARPATKAMIIVKTETVSVISEQQECEKDGGNFSIVGSDVVGDWQASPNTSLELICSKQENTTYFDIVIPETKPIAH